MTGAGWPGWSGAGAPNVCASCCSGAGSAPATAVPQTARTIVASIPAAMRGILRGGRPLRGRAVAPAPAVLAAPAVLTAVTNAATLAASVDNSCSVPGRAAARSATARVRWAGEASGPASWPASSRSAITSSSDSRAGRDKTCEMKGILARKPLSRPITLRPPARCHDSRAGCPGTSVGRRGIGAA